jgi:oligosaccharide repeat unit polymerase
MLYLLSKRDLKLDAKVVAVILVFASPHLIHAALSASRGTAFLTLAAIVYGWYLAAARRPSLKSAIVVLVGMGLTMLFLKAHRQEIYVGSNFEFGQQPASDLFIPRAAETGNPSTYSWGLILMSHYNNTFFWGKRYATQLFIRPIPKQIWPDKYEAMGQGWMVDRPGSNGWRPSQWLSTVGWLPDAGSASGFVADTFIEFSWGGLLVCFLIGYFYTYLWKRSAITKGLWSLIYFEACVTSVFVATQGLMSAWMYRFLYLAVPTVLLWKWAMSYAGKRLPAFAAAISPTHAAKPGPMPPKIVPGI